MHTATMALICNCNWAGVECAANKEAEEAWGECEGNGQGAVGLLVEGSSYTKDDVRAFLLFI